MRCFLRAVYILIAVLVAVGCSRPNSPLLNSLSLGEKVKREYFTNGKLRSEFIMFDNTGLNGVKKVYGLDGKLISISPIKNGVKHGVEKWFDKQGRLLMSIPYENGRKHGVQTIYYENGEPLITYTYVRGFKHGPSVVYNKNGTIAKRVLFQNDVKVSG